MPSPCCPPQSRPGGGRGFVVRLARRGIVHATGWTATQPLSGMRCLHPRGVRGRPPAGARLGGRDRLTIDLLTAGYRVVEVPCDLQHRVTGADWRGQVHRAPPVPRRRPRPGGAAGPAGRPVAGAPPATRRVERRSRPRRTSRMARRRPRAPMPGRERASRMAARRLAGSPALRSSPAHWRWCCSPGSRFSACPPPCPRSGRPPPPRPGNSACTRRRRSSPPALAGGRRSGPWPSRSGLRAVAAGARPRPRHVAARRGGRRGRARRRPAAGFRRPPLLRRLRPDRRPGRRPVRRPRRAASRGGSDPVVVRRPAALAGHAERVRPRRHRRDGRGVVGSPGRRSGSRLAVAAARAAPPSWPWRCLLDRAARADPERPRPCRRAVDAQPAAARPARPRRARRRARRGVRGGGAGRGRPASACSPGPCSGRRRRSRRPTRCSAVGAAVGAAADGRGGTAVRAVLLGLAGALVVAGARPPRRRTRTSSTSCGTPAGTCRSPPRGGRSRTPSTSSRQGAAPAVGTPARAGARSRPRRPRAAPPAAACRRPRRPGDRPGAASRRRRSPRADRGLAAHRAVRPAVVRRPRLAALALAPATASTAPCSHS